MSRLGLDRTLNRLVHVGLWAIMKSPLLLSSDLPSLVPALIQMVNNTEVIAVNQDALGVQVMRPACHFPFLCLHH